MRKRRSTWLRRLLAVVGVLVLLVAAFVVRTLYHAGAFKHVTSHFAGSCRRVVGPVGVEDITIHPRTGIAYLSSCDRRALAAGKPVPGAIYAYDLNAADPKPVNLTPDAGTSFQPHGISLWNDPDGNDRLFVIQHAPMPDGPPHHAVEIFNITPDGALVSHSTVGSPLLVTPNDLVAVGPSRFYLTNTHKYPPGFWQTVETYLQLTGAQVLFYNGVDLRPVIDDVAFPNGINVSRDGRKLYLASTTGRAVYVYARDLATEQLKLERSIYLGSGADNIEVDDDGTVWVAAHPQLLKVGSHGKDPKQPSPSQVFRVRPGGNAEEIYADSGAEVSAASVAAVRGKRMLIGDIFDDGILDCTLP